MMKISTISLSATLKDHTKTSHQLLEKKLIHSIKNIQTESDYAKVLKHFYSFFGGMEAFMDKGSAVSFLPDYTVRRKTASIANDLFALQNQLPAFALKDDLPVIDNEQQAAGALYVMEGSTLGGIHIAEMIRKKINKPRLNAFTFFDGYGNDTMKMWTAFKDAIDGLQLTTEQEKIVIVSADDTFTLFSKWIDKN